MGRRHAQALVEVQDEVAAEHEALARRMTLPDKDMVHGSVGGCSGTSITR
jgi:hypothetical protein